MLKSIVNHQIDKAEQQLGVDLEYARYIAGVSISATWRLARFTKLLHSNKGPKHAVHVASIVGAMADDCGSCVQIGVNLARQAGVPPQQLAAVAERRPEDLPDELASVYRFADAVTLNNIEQDELREVVRRRYGDAGLVEICLAIAMHRVYPTLKRGLGYAQSCSRVTVAI